MNPPIEIFPIGAGWFAFWVLLALVTGFAIGSCWRVD